jgi:hypothetical protein
MPKQPYPRATLYVLQSFPAVGFARIEARDVSHGTRDVPRDTIGHSACESAVFANFLKKSGRKWKQIVESNNPSLVILEGWGHPKFENWVPAEVAPKARDDAPSIDTGQSSTNPSRAGDQLPLAGLPRSDALWTDEVDAIDAFIYPGLSSEEIQAHRAQQVKEARPYQLYEQRFGMLSAEWEQAFSEFLEQLTSNGAVILADYRGHDVKRKLRLQPPPVPGSFEWALLEVLAEDEAPRTPPPPPSYSSADEIRDPTSLHEGAVTQVVVNAYERNPRARQECIAHYGSRCSVCDFDFEQVYGEIGRDFIHVHHLVPLSEIGKEYQINPVQDLRPVCPNCHAMLHRRMPPLSVLELKEKIQATGQRATAAQVQTLQELWHRYKGEWPSEMHITRWQGMSWSEAIAGVSSCPMPNKLSAETSSTWTIRRSVSILGHMRTFS